MTVTYREANAADASALADIARDTFLATFGHLYPAADRDAFIAQTYTPAVQGAEIADAQTRHQLAERDGRLIGFAKCGAYKLPAAPIDVTPYELHRLYVLEEAKGQGVADRLMAWVIERAREAGADGLYLGVYHENFRAQRFYARHGFERFGEYFFEVGSIRDPEFILRKPL